VSIQKWVCDLSFTLNEPKDIKLSLTFISPFKKWESVGLLVQLPRVLSFIYLFLNNSCHKPSSSSNLKSHLLNRHLFYKSKLCMPKPPCVFGWHIISHLVNLYFRLWWSLCQ
jgi:hypothetical protein